MNYLEIFNRVNATSSGTQKIQILKCYQTNTILRRIFELTYHPGINFYLTSGSVNFNPQSSDQIKLEDALTVFQTLADRKVTGHAAIREFESVVNKLSSDHSELFRRILDRDLKCGASVETANKVWRGVIPCYPVMLARCDAIKNRDAIWFPAIAQIKSDGTRGNLHVSTARKSVTATSRNGKPIDCVNDSIREMALSVAERLGAEDLVLDGELLVRDEFGKTLKRQTSNGIINKAIRGTIKNYQKNRIFINLWDWVTHDEFWGKIDSKMNYFDRFSQLRIAIEDSSHLGNSVQLIESRTVNSWDDCNSWYREVVQRGEEGLIIKNHRGFWENERSRHLVKMKEILSCEVKIIGVEEGKDKYTGMLGAFVYEGAGSDPVRGHVGSGFTDKQRVEFWKNNMIGKIAEIEYNSITTDKKTNTRSLYLPRFLEIREDKNQPDEV